MFGWHPRLSVDAYLGTDPSEEQAGNHSSYASKLRQRLQFAYRTAAEEASKLAARNKDNYDRHVRHTKIEIGDQVLIRKVGMQGTHKLADKWDRDIYRVIDIPNDDIPVYHVQKVDGKGPIKILHRNLLLPFNSLPIEELVETTGRSVCKDTTRKTRSQDRSKSSVTGHVTSTDSSESESDSSERYIPPALRSRNYQNLAPQKPPRQRLEESTIRRSTRIEPESSQPQESLQSTGPDHTAPEVSTPSVQPSHDSSASATSRNQLEVSETVHTAPSPEPPPREPRPVRQRKVPDRLGEWVSPVIVSDDGTVEIFI